MDTRVLLLAVTCHTIPFPEFFLILPSWIVQDQERNVGSTHALHVISIPLATFAFIGSRGTVGSKVDALLNNLHLRAWLKARDLPNCR